MPTAATRSRSACPDNGQVGRPVQTLTLKALLRPPALAQLDPSEPYFYCGDPACHTVYYARTQTFGRDDLKVPVFAKDGGDDVPVCYCFDWTRQRLRTTGERAAESIRHHVRVGRCGCEVNNPRGVCCLGDVVQVLATAPAAAEGEGNEDCCRTG